MNDICRLSLTTCLSVFYNFSAIGILRVNLGFYHCCYYCHCYHS